MPPNEALVVGKDRLRDRNGAALEQFTFEIDITNEEVAVADDLAYSRGVYTATLAPTRQTSSGSADAVPAGAQMP